MKAGAAISSELGQMAHLSALLAHSYVAPAPMGVVSRASAVRMAFKDTLEGVSVECAGKKWDPIGISDVVDDSTL